MCIFCKTSELESIDKKTSKTSKSFINLFLKPNKEGERYRFRLLFYRQPSKNDRKEAYIHQKIHNHWGVTESGKKIVDDVIICPGTNYAHYDDKKFVVNEKTGKPELNCPICKKAKENMKAWINSGKTDKLSIMKFNQLKQQERLCIPVYVIHDPNTYKDEDGERIYLNDGKFRVLILTNKEDIELFKDVFEQEKTKVYLAAKEGNPYEMFNGSNAVDLYIQYGTVPSIRNAGTEKEYPTEIKKITNIAFGKKVSPISAINKEAIDKFEFDDQYYFSNTKDELLSFYKRHFGNNDVAPEEEDVFNTNDDVIKNKPTQITNTENTYTQKSIIEDTINESSDLDDLLDDDGDDDTDNKPSTALQDNENEEVDVLNDLDSLLDDDLNF